MLSGLGEGAYSVVVFDDSGCSVEVEDINVLAGMFDVAHIKLSAYPNPASSDSSVQASFQATLGQL